MSQSEFEANACNRRQAREKAYERVKSLHMGWQSDASFS